MLKNIFKLFDEPHEIIGWLGMGALLVAYALLVAGVFSADAPGYHLTNLFGSLGIMYVSFKTRAYPPAVLNVIWIAIALIALAHFV